MREVARLLDRNRLVTLTGAGRVGQDSSRPGGCDGARQRVPRRRLARGAGGPERPGAGGRRRPPPRSGSPSRPSDRLSKASAPSSVQWHALLILDNCEHLIARLRRPGRASAGRLPGAAHPRHEPRTPARPGRGDLAGSVAGASRPRSGRLKPAELAAYESIRLFCERASDVASSFALGEDNAGAVAEICSRLDGMPLALELAAARVGALSPAQIAERLGDSLAVLTAGSRSALDRQQTLRATLSWSHALLTGAERALFRRLAVFAGSFRWRATEEVAAGAGVEERQVADLLGRLVDKSLVVAEEDADGYRYRLLEPMRQYARERLAEAGEAMTVEARHLAFSLELARAADPEGAEAGPLVALDRLEADHDNLRAALAWALRHEPEQALRLAVHMWPMWMAGSHFQEGSRWLAAALAAAPAPTELRAEALRAACGLEIRLGRTGGLSELGTERVAIFRALGDRRAVAHALDEVGVYEYMAGRYDRAERLYAQSRALGEELGDRKVLGGGPALRGRARPVSR